MAKYTIELRNLLASGYDIGLNDYHIYDETYRTVLNQKIIDRYYMREIGAETPGLFKLFFGRTLREIMPYYNELYKSALLVIDPLQDYKLTESTQRVTAAESTGTMETATDETKTTDTEITDDNIRVGSDTPSGLLAAPDIKGNLYASNADREENAQTTKGTAAADINTSSTGETIAHTLDEYIRNISGITGRQSPAALLMEYRKSIINIDLQVLDALADCFMQVY